MASFLARNSVFHKTQPPMPRPATRLSSLLVAPMAPVLLGGYDATMRRSNGVQRSAAEVHPYKMPKVEGTPAVLVASSLELFFGRKTKNERRYTSPEIQKERKQKSMFFFPGLQPSTSLIDFFP